MKPFTFSLNTLLKVKSHAFEKDALALALLQKKMAHLEKRREALQQLFDELVEAAVENPSFAHNLEAVSDKIALLEREMSKEKQVIKECQKTLSESLNRRKVVEKIKEKHYALYQKECVRFHDTTN